MTTPTNKLIEEAVEEMAQQEWLLSGDVPIAQDWLRNTLTNHEDAVLERVKRLALEIVSTKPATNDPVGKLLWHIDHPEFENEMTEALTTDPLRANQSDHEHN